MAGKAWTTGEIERLRQRMGVCFSWPEIAEGMPGRSAGACQHKARSRGWHLQGRYRDNQQQEALTERIRELNDQGWPDIDIAQTLRISREYVGILRRRVGLRSNKGSRLHRDRTRQAMRRQLQRNRLASLAELKSIEQAKRARAAGWPADCTPVECEALAYLEEVGEGTYHAFCEASGRRYHKSKCAKTAGGQQVFRSLVKKGYVRWIGRRQYAPGKGKTRHTYALAIERRHVAGLTQQQIAQQEQAA